MQARAARGRGPCWPILARGSVPRRSTSPCRGARPRASSARREPVGPSELPRSPPCAIVVEDDATEGARLRPLPREGAALRAEVQGGLVLVPGGVACRGRADELEDARRDVRAHPRDRGEIPGRRPFQELRVRIPFRDLPREVRGHPWHETEPGDVGLIHCDRTGGLGLYGPT